MRAIRTKRIIPTENCSLSIRRGTRRNWLIPGYIFDFIINLVDKAFSYLPSEMEVRNEKRKKISEI